MANLREKQNELKAFIKSHKIKSACDDEKLIKSN